MLNLITEIVRNLESKTGGNVQSMSVGYHSTLSEDFPRTLEEALRSRNISSILQFVDNIQLLGYRPLKSSLWCISRLHGLLVISMDY